ncbi:MAG: inosine 5-monophosphate dehydrogenase [Bacteroidota bacterium]|nr:inosine 5-monophosphate dehydrogenase [Bacteroidota bacterium]
MPLSKPVSTIMSSSPVVGSVTSKFSQVLRLFTEFPVHHLPIVDADNKLIGIVSSNDLPKVFFAICNVDKPVLMGLADIDNSVSLESIMSPNPVTISSGESIAAATQIFKDKKFLALPVVDNGVLVGILSVKDIMGYIA